MESTQGHDLPDVERRWNALDFVAVVAGLGALLLVLGLNFYRPLRAWTLAPETPVVRRMVIELIADQGYERFLPVVADLQPPSDPHAPRVVSVDQDHGIVRLEVDVREEPNGARRWGSNWLRPGQPVVFQDRDIYFQAIVIGVDPSTP